MGAAVEKVANVVIASAEASSSENAQKYAKEELTKRFRRAATLAFGIYNAKFAERERPRYYDPLLQGVTSWREGDHPWTDGFKLIKSVETTWFHFTVHSSPGESATLGRPRLWITFRGTDMQYSQLALQC